MAGQLHPTSVWPTMTSLYCQTNQSPPHWPAIYCPSSSPSTPNCPRLMGLGEPTSILRKRTGHVMLKPATNTWLKLAKQEPFNKPRKPKASGLFMSTGRIPRIQPTLSASAKSLPGERDRMCRRNAQRSKHTDPETGGGRQANQTAIRLRQMRPSITIGNHHH